MENPSAIVRMCAITLLGVVVWGGASGASAAETLDKAEQVTLAAALRGFANYTEWPGNAFRSKRDPFILGILGDDPFGNAFEQFEASLKNRDFVVKRFRKMTEVIDCQLLFVSRSFHKQELASVLQSLAGKSVLTVAFEFDGFIEQGGILNFVMVKQPGGLKKKVQWRVNQEAARQASLAIHSQLLSASLQ